MVEMAGRLLLGVVLAAAATAKIARPEQSRSALATYGFRPGAQQWLAWLFVVGAELALAIGVIAGSDAAAYAGGGLMLLFAATLGSALIQGKAGAPCACFGGGSTVGWTAILRNLALAAALFSLPLLPGGSLSTDEWLGLGLGAALLASAALGIAVLALAREVGMLRLRLGSTSALELAHEGPELGGRTNLIERFELGERAELALAVFSSSGCRVCAALRPAVDSLRAEPSLGVRDFDEEADAEVWRGLGIPGAPYALALDRDGTVMAKGTFNNLAQLESVLATAERRRARPAREALGV